MIPGSKRGMLNRGVPEGGGVFAFGNVNRCVRNSRCGRPIVQAENG